MPEHYHPPRDTVILFTDNANWSQGNIEVFQTDQPSLPYVPVACIVHIFQSHGDFIR
jgi:hypothetical protein